MKKMMQMTGSSNAECFIAVDPGREKTGLAVLKIDGSVLWHGIRASEMLQAEIDELIKRYDASFIVMGSGTSSKAKQKLLRQAFPQTELFIVNEYRTTDEARKLYFKLNPPRGLRRLIPRGMQVPPVPVDDYAAIIIGRKFLEQKR